MQIFCCENEIKECGLVVPKIINASYLIGVDVLNAISSGKSITNFSFLAGFVVLLICFRIEICYFFSLLIGVG